MRLPRTQLCNQCPITQRPMAAPNMDITALIPRILSGDSRAYAEVVRTYEHMVYTVCHRVLRNTEDAEEATQDAFVKAYQHLASYSGQAKFSTWLYSIAYRTAVSHGRNRRMESSSLDDMHHHPKAEQVDELRRNEAARHLGKALACLSPEDSAILSFFHLDELSVEEIVTVTGLGASNVKVKLHRARKKLLEVLNKELGAEAHDLLLEHA